MNKTRLAFTILCAALILPLTSCWKSGEPAKKEGLFVVNVLDKNLYDDCHIKGSIQVSFEDLEKFAKDLDKEKAEVVFYCSNYMCTTSGYACNKLLEMGFKHVWAYEGGMAEWYQLGLPVEGAACGAYLNKKVEKPADDEQQGTNILTASQLEHKMLRK